jgi:hypothetical protein
MRGGKPHRPHRLSFIFHYPGALSGMLNARVILNDPLLFDGRFEESHSGGIFHSFVLYFSLEMMMGVQHLKQAVFGGLLFIGGSIMYAVDTLGVADIEIQAPYNYRSVAATKRRRPMNWAIIIVIVFSILTVYFTYDEYKKGKTSRKLLNIICALEAAVVAICLAISILLR